MTILAANSPPAKIVLPDILWARQIASVLLFAVVVAAPICFGSTDATITAVWCVALGAVLLIVPLRDAAPRHLAIFLAVTAVTVAGYAFVLHEQTGEPWIAAPDPLWAEAARLLEHPVAGSPAIASHQPWLSLGNTLACLSALICGFALGADRDTARRLLRVIAFSGAALAIYGIAAHALDPTHILWREKLAYRDVLTATFVNRNTAAVYFGSCAIVWFIFFSERIREWRGLNLRWPAILGDFFHRLDGKTTFYFAGLFVCLAAVFMTASRAGTAFSLLGLVVAGIALFRTSLSRSGRTMIGLALLAFIGLTLLQIMGAGVLGRFDLEGLAEGGRVQTYAATLRMIGDHPWFGVGLGNFVWSYPSYRGDDISMWGVWDRAHSTPLELAAELGLPLTLLICLDWLVILALLGRGLFQSQRIPSTTLAAFCTALIAVLHSAMDFSLQVPGFSILVFALVGAGIAQSLRPASRIARPPENSFNRVPDLNSKRLRNAIVG